MRLQLAIGKALEQKNNNIEALRYLHPLQERSRVKEEWGIYVECCLLLAELYLEMRHSNTANQYLAAAEDVIYNQNLITRFEPEFAILKGLWHRDYGAPDSVLFFIDLAVKDINLETGNYPKIQTSYYFLRGAMNFNTDLEAAIMYMKKAAAFAKSNRDYESLVGFYGTMSSHYSYMGNQAKFIQYNDSVFYAAYKVIANGELNSNAMAYAFEKRCKYYKEIGKLDSAMINQHKQIGEERLLAEQQESFKVAELDIKYNFEKQADRLSQQEAEISTNQKIRWLLISIILLVLFSLALLVQNYRRQKQTNQQLEKQAKQLATLDKMKSRFFANASHELRTPLTLMLGVTNTLLNESHLLPKHMQLLKIAENSGKQLHSLINEILNLRKLEVGELAVLTQATELYAFFTHYCVQFESLAKSKTIDFSFDIQIEQDLIGELDQEKCRQIVYNLLSNAFKFTPEKGQINLKVGIEDKTLRMRVSDTGEGIHPDDIRQVFDRYFQTNRPEKPIEGGTGIGLALCKEYVQLLGGKIEVDSILGKGSTFTLFFPINLIKEAPSIVQPEQVIPDVLPENKETVVLEMPKTKNGASTKPTILVVEDNLDLANYLKYILSKKYEVTLAENGQKAWDYLIAKTNGQQNEHYQLILSDLMMPVMDGYQLLEKLKSSDQTRHLPVIMLTARADVKDKLKALRIGVDDYLLKPFEEEELLVRIANLLSNQTIRQQTQPVLESEKPMPLISQEDQKWLTDFEYFVQKNLQNNQLSVPMLAKNFSMSESTLLRQLKRLTSLTPAKYIQAVRLEEARVLLENGTYNSVRLVAFKMGYKDPDVFSRAFKRKYGKTPSSFVSS
jgi:signal transduction histidine kinase/DNA-binding response OmpR family regulator